MSEFIPSELLRRRLDEQPRNMRRIVGAIIGFINADPRFNTNRFDEGVKYVLRQGISESELFSVYQPMEGDLFREPEKWDEQYYSLSLVRLKDNFCKERIEHVKAIARKLYPREQVQPAHQERPQAAGKAQDRNGGVPPKKAKGQQDRQDRMVQATRIIAVAALLLAVIVLILVLILK